MNRHSRACWLSCVTTLLLAVTPASIAAAPVATPPPPGPVTDVKFPPALSRKLANGMAVVVAEDHRLPTVYLLLVVRGGSSLDPRSRPGLGGMIGALLREGTSSRSKDELLGEIEFVGGDLASVSLQDCFEVSARVLREHIDVALDLVADVAGNASFPASAVEKVRARQLSELRANLAEPRYLARRQLHRVLYGERHPYGQYGPTEEGLTAITRGELVDAYRKTFVPGQSLLVVVGDVKPEQVLARVEGRFGSWPAARTATLSLPTPAAHAGRAIYLVDRPHSQQAFIVAGDLAPPRQDRGWLALRVAHQILGGGSMGRLFEVLRERKGYTYSAFSSLGESVGTGLQIFSTAVRNQVAAPALDDLLEELRRIGTTAPTAGELADARNYLTGNFPIQVDDPGRVAQMIAQQWLFGLPRRYWDTYRGQVTKLPAAKIARQAARHIRAQRVAVVVVGDAAVIEKPLSAAAPVEVYEASGKLLRRLAMER